jgi:hypothetical protein
LFKPRNVRLFGPAPVFLYVGRIAVEKNVSAFLALDLPGRKVVVGDGPQAGELKSLYPEALFTGPLAGEVLADSYASADAFVFPSVTDTFGLVLLEALAAGLPVAAFPATGPLDVLTDARAAVIGADLREAALKALELDRAAARAHALRFSWEHSARQFFENVLAAHHLGLPARLKRRKSWRKKDKSRRKKETARLGGTRPFYSHASVWGTLWGNRVFLKMVRSLPGFKGTVKNFYNPVSN